MLLKDFIQTCRPKSRLIKDAVSILLNVVTSLVSSIAKLLIEIIWKIPNFFLLIVVTLIPHFL